MTGRLICRAAALLGFGAAMLAIGGGAQAQQRCYDDYGYDRYNSRYGNRFHTGYDSYYNRYGNNDRYRNRYDYGDNNYRNNRHDDEHWKLDRKHEDDHRKLERQTENGNAKTIRPP